MRPWTLALLAVALLVGPAAHGDKKAPAKSDKDGECCCCEAPLKVGAVASGPGSVTVFRALRHYLGKNKMPAEFVLYSTYDGLNEALRNKQIDLAWNTPLGHAKFHRKSGDSQTLVMRDVDVNFRVKLVARKDSKVTRLGELAGKTMVFGSNESADCTVLPIYFLKKEGAPLDKVKCLSLHDQVDEQGCPCDSQRHVLAALLAGRAQAGVISSALWKHLKANKPEEAALLREVWTSPTFSHCVFTARKDFDKETGEKFTKLMTSMTGKDPLTATVLKLEGCSKWVPVSKEARAGFDDLLKALEDKSLLPAALRK